MTKKQLICYTGRGKGRSNNGSYTKQESLLQITHSDTETQTKLIQFPIPVPLF